jgi:hypothetical protein
MKYAILLLALTLTACGPLETPDTQTAQTVLIAEHDGCKIYHTRTAGPFPNVTWVRCKKEPEVTESHHTESCGKGCTRTVKTVVVEDL